MNFSGRRRVNRMRLIDADEVINILKETGIIQDNELGHCVIDEINRIPTAYDVDKVVEELEEYSNADEAERHGTIPVIELDDAIEIVKGGGIDG